ncbi:MAG: DUF4296 domain-containing protein [Flavobacteriaceae bacterium]|nr:DUF4296 domain-containing protein [Flavobacteriaceae bacterium]
MKKILSFLMLLILFVSCKEEVIAKPDRLIEKNKMIDIMYDLAILEGIKYSKPESLDSNQINSANYIYKKYQVDSLQLAQSNVYYASDYVEYNNMYDELIKRIERKKTVLDSVVKINKNSKSRKDSLQAIKGKAKLKKDSILNKKAVMSKEEVIKRATLQ